MNDEKLTRIGVFYNGNYFLHVSNFYRYNHARRSRISISGLHEFIINEIAEADSKKLRLCKIVESHYFRGRISAEEADQRNQLYKDRQFDDILIREGITSYHVPLNQCLDKGVDIWIDVWMALQAFELSALDRFDVVVLIGGDAHLLPLIKKINALGKRVMLVGWDLKYKDDKDIVRETRISQSLLNESTYSLVMNQIINDHENGDAKDPLVNELFVTPREKVNNQLSRYSPHNKNSDFLSGTGRVLPLREGYGFIKPDEGGENLYFHYSDVLDDFFHALQADDAVRYQIGTNEKGPCAKRVELIQ